jgi:hypothetical protein
MRPETEADDRRHANGINDLNVVFSKERERRIVTLDLSWWINPARRTADFSSPSTYRY